MSTDLFYRRAQKIGLAYIWQNQQENNTNKLGTVIAENGTIQGKKCVPDGWEEFIGVLPINKTHLD
jgi:hypothetical protein